MKIFNIQKMLKFVGEIVVSQLKTRPFYKRWFKLCKDKMGRSKVIKQLVGWVGR
jgi:hypothetical protein